MAEAVVRSEEAVDMEMDLELEKMKKMEEEKRGSSKVVKLPGMVLRVLLVEADDSTRHIISALLRKCDYRVSAVPDGLMAWETLRGGPHNIDLILTEVELPSISGFALLTLVMEHEICKNIPVIMMSSNDSISMVLKCMLKGAADFLIKPVRRNELRNLWQHVWRRQTPKVEASSENNVASSLSSDYAESTYKDKECGKQSFSEGLSERNVTSASNLSNTNKEKRGECAEVDEESVAPTPETKERKNKLGLEIGYQDETHSVTASRLDEAHGSLKAEIQAIDVELEGHRGNLNIHSEVNCCNDDVVETSRGVIDLIGTFDDRMKCNYEQFNNDDGINGSETAPYLELSLRRSCPTSSKEGPSERHILNHSVASAFSRYNHGKAWKPLFPASTTICNGLREGAKLCHELLSNEQPDITRGDSQQHGAISTCSRENITAQVVGGQTEQAFPISVPVARYDICAGNNHVLTHMCHKQSGLPSVWTPKVSCQQEQSRVPTSTSVSVHNSEQVCHRSNETTNTSSDQDMHEQNKMDTMEGPGFGSSAAGQSATSSLCNGFMDHDNDGAYGSSFNKSERKSNLPVIDDRGRAPESLDSSRIIHDRFLGMDSNRLSQREAALMKFRLKRKERCYEKKVRYQSRKRLAEQRPRVKGQFVRQVQNDTEQ
ncbi:pseudo-response regulator 9 [Tripterygium wilfordii]|uniref:Pseudo-response regulator 9 n=1 Tax=Tripterygium wilfordii TaxID=458696 RepID=A0A7J7DCT5_TRIWF|nr:two-component response regulator-like APRR3 [Tripterygium wilfordii]XP_038709728.1 two-component response regulator-like APRR3 [Tripterygium wilfordii]KAF5743876.1 pseudo-response regulator 9 [Tripterygium wilfordii]